MEAVPDPMEYLAGYVYSSPDGTKVPLSTDQVIFVRRPHPMDQYRGISPVSAVAWDLDADNAAARYNSAYFRNNAEPGGVIVAPQRLSDREFNELKTRWNDNHRGVANAHRVAILAGEGFDYKDRNVTQRDMQFVELRGISTEMVRLAWRYPKPMLGTVEDVNRANAEAAETVYARWLMIDRLERIKQALNFDFLPLFGSAGEGVEFDYCDPTPENAEAEQAELTSKVNAFKTLVDTGKVDPVAALEFLGLPSDMYKEPEPVPAPLAPPQAPGVPEDQPVPTARLNGRTHARMGV
jgi:HK97 family phage portal protein